MDCKQPASRRRTFTGMTLVEALVGITVIGVLLALSAPALSSTLERMRLAKATNDLLGDIVLARTESIRTGQRVVVCKGRLDVGCLTGATDWNGGWIVFIDRNRNGARDLTDAGEILIGSGRASSNVRIFGNTHVRDFVAYSPQGFARTHTGALQLGTITLCLNGRSQSSANRIIISRSGRARVEEVNALACSAS